MIEISFAFTSERQKTLTQGWTVLCGSQGPNIQQYLLLNQLITKIKTSPAISVLV